MRKYIMPFFLIISSCGDALDRQKHLKGNYYIVTSESYVVGIGIKESSTYFMVTPGDLEGYWLCDSLVVAKVLEKQVVNYYVLNLNRRPSNLGHESTIGPVSFEQLKNDGIYSECITDVGFTSTISAMKKQR